MNKSKLLLFWWHERSLKTNSNQLTAWTHRLTLIVNLLCLTITSIIITHLPPQIPLWYSRPWGEDRLSAPLWLFALPISSMIIQAINRYLSFRLLDKLLIFNQLIYLTSFIISLMSLLVVLNIIFLVK